MNKFEIFCLKIVVENRVYFFPDTYRQDTRSPIPSVLIGSLSSERIVSWKMESIFLLEYFSLILIVNRRRSKSNDQSVLCKKSNRNFISSEHIVSRQNNFSIKFDLGVSI